MLTMRSACSSHPIAPAARAAFTLIEVLLVVVILGIAGVLVIPSMSQTNVLRVQTAVRTVVSDLTFIQSEAVAFQSRRAVMFGVVPRFDATQDRWVFVEGNGYTLAEVRGPDLDLDTDALQDPDDPSRPFGRDFDDDQYGGATIAEVGFNGGELLIFDELGGPVEELDGPEPGDGGSLEVRGEFASFRVDVQAYTGRIRVTKVESEPD